MRNFKRVNNVLFTRKLAEVLPCVNIPVAVKVRPPQIFRQGKKLLHIIRIGIHKNPVVIDFCGNEIVILCIFTLLILSVDKQPLHPCMADVAGVAGVIHARRNIRSCRAVAGRQKPHLFFRKVRCFLHADDCIFLSLILVNILRRVAITEFDSRPVGEPEHALG